MEKNNNYVSSKSEDENKNSLTKNIEVKLPQWCENVTVLDLSSKKIKTLDDYIKFPTHLQKLDLSKNLLQYVPDAVLCIETLKYLNISDNNIEYFDITPSFCHCIVEINISINKLKGFPYWILVEQPLNLQNLDISCNTGLTKSFVDIEFDELLEFNNNLNYINLANCNLGKYCYIIGAFRHATVVIMGSVECTAKANHIEEMPFNGLDKCATVQRLNLCNTRLYNINVNIKLYQHLIEINFSCNYLHSLPEELGLLVNLEICLLSHNNLIYVPDSMCNLKFLACLHLDNNELCTIQENICQLQTLTTLDLYNNNLYEIPEVSDTVEKIDVAQNYFDEPIGDYFCKKERLRINMTDRLDGRKPEPVTPEYNGSPDSSDDEEFLESESNQQNNPTEQTTERCSSPEDWDSDDHWIPHFYCTPVKSSPNAPWLYFVKNKMAEGNFCPMDAHPVSISETVKYEKMLNPVTMYESDGQFDDCSTDNDS